MSSSKQLKTCERVCASLARQVNSLQHCLTEFEAAAYAKQTLTPTAIRAILRKYPCQCDSCLEFREWKTAK